MTRVMFRILDQRQESLNGNWQESRITERRPDPLPSFSGSVSTSRPSVPMKFLSPVTAGLPAAITSRRKIVPVAPENLNGEDANPKTDITQHRNFTSSISWLLSTIPGSTPDNGTGAASPLLAIGIGVAAGTLGDTVLSLSAVLAAFLLLQFAY
ncbi:hypothetical protein DFH09DRAFT_1080102 [Mycena vulgaris]|nr:hypothetical protein DFH09DRAFT_1080102 [Mycena vulgaris]